MCLFLRAAEWPGSPTLLPKVAVPFVHGHCYQKKKAWSIQQVSFPQLMPAGASVLPLQEHISQRIMQKARPCFGRFHPSVPLRNYGWLIPRWVSPSWQSPQSALAAGREGAVATQGKRKQPQVSAPPAPCASGAGGEGCRDHGGRAREALPCSLWARLLWVSLQEAAGC